VNTKMKNNKSINIRPHISGALRGFLVGILVLIQMCFILLLSLSMTSYTVYFYVALEVASFLVIVALVNENKSNPYKIAWICIVLMLPLSGHVMYLLWGATDTSKKIEKRIIEKINNGFKYIDDDTEERKIFKEKYSDQRRLSDYMSANKFPLYKNNTIDYYKMGEDAFEAIINDLKTAKKYIFINFFIVAEGKLWDRIHKILKEKIDEGVEVKFLYDDFGSMFRTSKYFKYNLEMEGFKVRVFNPIHKYFDKLYMNYRSHQKIVVIDGEIGYTGGINLADEYANIQKRFGVWKDNAVRIKGQAVNGFVITFLQMWDVCSEMTDIVDYNKYKQDKKYPKNDVFCHIIADGHANQDPFIENVYKQMISHTNDFIYITTPYLIIDDGFMNEIKMAAKRGVDIRIITPNIPDKKTVKVLTNYNYGKLLRQGVRIYEYTPGFIHAKTMVNENSTIVGTVNLDYRSFYLHYECCAWMKGEKIINDVKYDLEETMRISKEITLKEWENRPLHLKILQLVINLFQTLI